MVKGFYGVNEILFLKFRKMVLDILEYTPPGPIASPE